MTSEGEGCKGYAVVLSVILVIILDSFWNTDQWVDGFSIILYDIVNVLDKTEKKNLEILFLYRYFYQATNDSEKAKLKLIEIQAFRMKVVNALWKLKQNFTQYFIHKTAKFSVILLL